MSYPQRVMTGVPAAHRAHPLLDPRLPSHAPAVARLWIDTYRRLRKDPSGFDRVVDLYARPFGSVQSSSMPLASYFHDADAYLDDLLRLVPAPLAQHLAPLPETRGLSAMRDLLVATFEGTHPRVRYEAQRKLGLARLLFDIDHCRSVRDGPRHKAQLEAILDATLWSGAEQGDEVEICAALREEAGGSQRFEVGVAPHAGSRCYSFRVRRLRPEGGDAGIDVYHFRCRYKRETQLAPATADADGMLHLAEEPRWPGLGRRSGSILSKMIRRSIQDPRTVQDVLGCMFIVGNRRQAYALERRLIHALGGPLRWRDRVDTLAGSRDRAHLDPQSSSSFDVLKAIVDLLMEDPAADAPYLFSVEMQIFPIESYLRTLYDAHFASHSAYKRRQFLNELLPALFPPGIYGGMSFLSADGVASSQR